MYFIGGLFILHGEMTIGSLLVFMKYYEMMFTQLGAINELDISFEIQAEARVAVVGRSGSGKSTLVKLLLGVYSLHTGIDGI